MQLENLVLDIRKNFDPEEIEIKISSLNIHADQPFLDLWVKLDDEEVRSENVIIDIVGYKDLKLQKDVFSDIDVVNDHPLLWKYNDLNSSLYFNGVAKDPYRLFGKLHRAHRGIYGDLLPPETYWNTVFLERDGFLPPFGLFASGPQKLMDAYARCFEEESVRCSQTAASMPVFWNGTAHMEGFQALKILFLDNSFIIAKDFVLRKRLVV
ncbi:hypothetical protein HF324_04765 [Chitinophaga oryzae]|uniref:Uncharacterized protein n=1 Tax=Chitinophaga oryzae TaxID=2725414 RepID=A0ABX6LAQ8_9BACT|nr:hypothetical protein [Chitinophaga oryzae]QJB37201.1 hypothetical protein HF324_04765 [Chitinophaga oryzae]